jgi:hypothetical protein
MNLCKKPKAIGVCLLSVFLTTGVNELKCACAEDFIVATIDFEVQRCGKVTVGEGAWSTKVFIIDIFRIFCLFRSKTTQIMSQY